MSRRSGSGIEAEIPDLDSRSQDSVVTADELVLRRDALAKAINHLIPLHRFDSR
jgi:hypothetical protein